MRSRRWEKSPRKSPSRQPRSLVIRTMILVGLFALSLTGTVQAADAATGSPTPAAVSTGRTSADTPARPSWCRDGFECVPTMWLADRTATVWKLRAELEKSKRDRFGWTLGCGPVLSGVVTANYDAKIVPTMSCGVVWGWRPR